MEIGTQFGRSPTLWLYSQSENFGERLSTRYLFYFQGIVKNARDPCIRGETRVKQRVLFIYGPNTMWRSLNNVIIDWREASG